MKTKKTIRTKKHSSANTKSKKARNRAVKGAEQLSPVLIVAGEESGDLLGATIVREVLQQRKLHLWGCGGHRLRTAGVDVRFSSEELSTIGFFEAAKNYLRLTKIMARIVAEAVASGTRHAWLIDFPGFNIMLAKKLKANGIRCTMVVSPTVWAWKYKRVFKIRDRFERVLCLYDFEPDIYNKIGVEAHYIGHPLTAETITLKQKFARHGNPLKKLPQMRELFRRKIPIIAVMPGSRPTEVHYHTARILKGIRLFARKHPNYAFVIAAANSKIYELLSRYDLPENTFLVKYSAPYVLDVAKAAIACSGTVTLECALFGVPHLILYRSSWMSYAIFKTVVRIPYIGMVNVLAGKFVVQEFLQHRLTPHNIASELDRILNDATYRRAQQGELKRIARRLTVHEPARQAASILLKSL